MNIHEKQKTMTIYGPNGEKLEARFYDTIENPEDLEHVYLFCRCTYQPTAAWCVPYIGPGYYHGVCPNCYTEIGIVIPNRDFLKASMEE